MSLLDTYGRKHDYLRISLTDKCNLRCSYCMPSEHYAGLPNKKLMTADEILGIAHEFVRLGVRKIRITGGEPLVRYDISEILSGLTALNCQLDITSNGVLLDRYWNELETSGIKTLNLSLDTLNRERFKTLARRDDLERVLHNIQEAVRRDFKVKLNCVVIANFNEDEILDFVGLTRGSAIDVRFIEFMPFNENRWEWEKVVSLRTILERIESKHKIKPLESHPNSTAKQFEIEGHSGRIGVISSVTSPFCSGCNRMRLTADGKMRNCLFSTEEFDLVGVYRNGGDLEKAIKECLSGKKKELGGLPQFQDQDKVLQSISDRSMIGIGG